MNQEGKSRNTKPESFDDQDMEKFQRFIIDNKYTADQMREAYYQLTGVSDDKEITSEASAILARMREMTDREFPLNSFPINRFATLIGEKQDYENPIPIYHGYVNELKISDKEKEMLGSVIEKDRKGEIVCLVDGKIVGEFEVDVKSWGKPESVTFIVNGIEEIRKHIPEGKKYELTFSEK